MLKRSKNKLEKTKMKIQVKKTAYEDGEVSGIVSIFADPWSLKKFAEEITEASTQVMEGGVKSIELPTRFYRTGKEKQKFIINVVKTSMIKE